jgi:parvulin-like peptidyl-prolyl isomerase
LTQVQSTPDAVDNALVGELIQDMARSARPTKKDVELYYVAHKNEFEQVRVRHILISYATAFASHSARSPEKAQARADEIASQLKHGAKFGALAANESDDPYTKAKGGDLGYV